MRTFNSYNEMAVANGSAPYIPMHLHEATQANNIDIENMSPNFKGMKCGSYALGCHSREFGGVGGKLEAPHIHASIGGVDKGKFWLEDKHTGHVSVDPHKTKGMSQADISKCIGYIQEHLQQAFDG